MKDMIFEDAKKKYNKLMNELGLEHLTIGTNFSEDTENWNIRDMVSECQYQLDVCYEEGNANSEGRYIDEYMDMYCVSYDDAVDAQKAWKSKTMKLRNFIRKYEKVAVTMSCTSGHCSKFD